MNLQSKKIWDLSPEEADYVYNNLHMNNYVYSSYKLIHDSKPPLNCILDFKKSKLPISLDDSIRNFTKLSPYIGNSDNTLVRKNYTLFAYYLFKEFDIVNINNLNAVVRLLSAISYISVYSDKNDGLLVWKHNIVRSKNKYIEKIFEKILYNSSPLDIIKMPSHENERIESDIEGLRILYSLIPKSISVILTMIENDIDRSIAAKAITNVESMMLKLEDEFCNSKDDANNEQHFKKQIRYRNTLYLYGASLFEKMGLENKAFSWYTKDLLFDNMPKYLDFYLTSMKTCERLISAYKISKSNNKQELKRIIDLSLIKSFKSASKYANLLFEYILSNPDADLSKERIETKEGKIWFFGGEAAREIFLIALYYNVVVNNADYKSINYKEFFEY